MSALAKSSFHACSKRDAGFAEPVADLVHRGEGLLPFVAHVATQQVALHGFIRK